MVFPMGNKTLKLTKNFQKSPTKSNSPTNKTLRIHLWYIFTTFTINLCQMEVNIPYMDSMGKVVLFSKSPEKNDIRLKIKPMILGEFVFVHQIS